MDARLYRLALPRAVGAFVLWAAPVMGQSIAPSADSSGGTPLAGWLPPASSQASTSESFHATTSPVPTDPFAVLSSGALWEQARGEIYTRDLGDAVSVSSQTSDIVLDENGEEMSRSEKVGLAFAPAPELTLNGNLHQTQADSLIPQDATTTAGGGVSAQSRLPTNSVVSLGLNFDRTVSDAPEAVAMDTRTYHAQIEQPLGKLPVSAVFKGEFAGASVGGTPTSRLPSLEPSLVWKPVASTTLQMGLRQQQYQEYPGVDHLMNEALFADLSQKVLDNVTWHSYAEVLNSKGLIDQAPASPIASGANGTPQATLPGSNASLTSSMPISFEDQTLTFSTGPSFQLQKDISASLEYSDRWDKNPTSGTSGQEQRVSVSVKGTF